MRTNHPKIYILIVLFIAIPALLLSFISFIQIYKERISLREKIERQLQLELQTLKRDLLISHEKLSKELKQTYAFITSRDFSRLVQITQQIVEKYRILDAFFLLDSAGKVIYPKPPTPKVWQDIEDIALLETQQIEYRLGPEEAYKSYLRLWRESGDSAELLNALARCAKKTGQGEQAKGFYRRLRDLADEKETPLGFLAAYELLVLEKNVLFQDGNISSERQITSRQEYILEILFLLDRLVLLEPILEEGFFNFLYPKVQACFSQTKLLADEEARFRRIQDVHEQNIQKKLKLDWVQQLQELVFSRLKKNDMDYLSDPERNAVYFCLNLPEGLSAAKVVFSLNVTDFLEQLRLLVESRNANNLNSLVRYGFFPITELSKISQPSSFSISLEPVLPWIAISIQMNVDELTQATSTSTYSYIVAVIVATIAIVGGLILILVVVHSHLQLANMKSDFVSSVTHELKTPLTSIRMFVETLQMGRIQDEADRQECLDIIVTESERLSRLIENVLSFSKTEKNTQKYNFQLEDLYEAVLFAIQLFKSQVNPEGFHIEVVPLLNLPEVRIDSDSIQDVLYNLLSNAHKYSKETVSIQISFGQTEKYVVVYIKDDGIGIPDKYKKKIFEKFFRVEEQITQRIEGCGLGLALARNTAKAHGGDLKLVSSEVGKGSCFALFLPYHKETKNRPSSRMIIS